jgi:serine/threonine-protein kinase RsbW
MPDEPNINREVIEMTVAGTSDEGQRAQQQLLDCMSRHAWDERSAFGVKLALEEALVNAIKHGNRSDPSKTIHVCYEVSPHEVRVRITDQGEGFDPGDVPDPTLPENLEKPSGRGLMLMRAYMSSVEFTENGTCVCMVKNRDEDESDD